jgi:hypothetical protein
VARRRRAGAGRGRCGAGQENIDYASLADAIRLTEAIVRRLDRTWV